MKTLIINGSPRKNGSTVKMINVLIQNIKGDIEVINTFCINIIPCDDCRYCRHNSACSKDDDMTQIYRLIEEADNIVIASPVYFCSVPAPLKALIDRFQIYWTSRMENKKIYLKPKKGLLMLAAGAPFSENQFTASILVLKSALKQINTQIIEIIKFSNSDIKDIDDDSELIQRIISSANLLNRM